MKLGVVVVLAVLATPAHAEVEGVITISRSVGADGPRSFAGARFAREPLLGTPVDRDGPCALYAAPPPTGLSAGTIAITGTAQPITLEGSRPVTVPDPMFADGATLAVAGAGGPDAPAFTAAVEAPPELTGFVPPVSVQRSGFTAHWTARCTGEIWIRVIAADRQAKDGKWIECRVPDTGSFTVPASLFARIPPTYREAAVMIQRVAETVVTAGDARIAIDAVSAIEAGPMRLVPMAPPVLRAPRETTPRLVMDIGSGPGGVSRIGDVPPTFGGSFRLQIGQRLGDGLHLVEEVNSLGSDFISPYASGGSEGHTSFGAGVSWRPFAPRSRSDDVVVFPGRIADARALYLTGVFGVDARDRYVWTAAGLVDHSALSPMASAAVTVPVLVGHDWSLGGEWREQIAYYDGHVQRGWMLLIAIDLQE